MRRLLLGVVALAASWTVPARVAAQPPTNPPAQPRVSALFPMGARAGTAVDVVVTGTDLDDATGVTFPYPGLTAVLVAPPEPAPAGKMDPKAKPVAPKKGPPPTSIRCKVTVDAGTPPGGYDLRVVNRFGVSNPRLFTVGTLPEVDEAEPNDEAVNPDPTAAVAGGGSVVSPRNVPRAQRVALGTTVNGVLASATDVDYSVFFGKAGQRVLASCLTSSIDSRARPLVEVYDAAGRRLGGNRGTSENDALCDVTLPADGDYFVRVSEFAYQQGGPDDFYRLTVGVGPWIDAVVPPVVNPGVATPVTVYGRNLPGGKVAPGLLVDGRPVETVTATLTAPKEATALTFRGRVPPPMGLADGFEFRLPGSNGVPVFLSEAKLYLEKPGDNNRPELAEAIPVPCDVLGRIDRRYDRDFYKFAAKKGETLVIELLAERLGSDADLSLRVRNDKGAELAGELDDDADTLHPTAFFTRNGDPAPYRFVAPADGDYTVLVSSIDANVNFGPRCFYRLRVTPPAPDYRAVVMPRGRDLPTTALIGRDGETALDVFVQRRDGYAGELAVTVAGLPKGVTARPTAIGPGSRWGTLVLSAAADAPEAQGPITVTLTGTIDGKPVSREARPAAVVWGVQPQQNVPTVTRLVQQNVLAVRAERSTFRLKLGAVTLKAAGKVNGKEAAEEKVAGMAYVRPGDKLTVPVSVVWQGAQPRANPVNVLAEATQPNPNGGPLNSNNNQPLAVPKEKNEATITYDVRANAAPGLTTLTLRAETLVNYARDPSQKDKLTPATVAAYAEPVAVTVLPAALVKVSVTPPPGGQVKLGATADFVVRVERLSDYAGELRVTVALPKDAKGVTLADATFPAGQSEAKLTVAAAKDAKAGPLANLPVTVTGTLHGKFPTVAESKLTLNVVK